MRVLIQRVNEASVIIDKIEKSRIDKGLLIFVGIENEDDEDDVEYLCNKITNLRIFDDENGVMNKSVKEIDGDILIVSQFTLHANTRKGNRPSYIKAAKPEISTELYVKFIEKMIHVFNNAVKTGEFGADMKVSLINDGPVTIWIDSKNKNY